MPAISHIVAYYAAMTSLYFEAAELGISTSHIAEFFLERWWICDIELCRAPITEVIRYR